MNIKGMQVPKDSLPRTSRFINLFKKSNMICMISPYVSRAFISNIRHSFDIHYRQESGVICFILQLLCHKTTSNGSKLPVMIIHWELLAEILVVGKRIPKYSDFVLVFGNPLSYYSDFCQ